MKKLLLVLALVLISAPAYASGSRNDDDNTAKLKTIDNKWLVHTTVSRGSVTSATVSLQAGNDGLLFGCSDRNNDLFVMMVVGKGIRQDIKKVQYRIGQDKYTDHEIDHIKLGTTLVIKEPASFVDKLRGKSRLGVRVSLDNGRHKDVVFDIRGIDKVIPPVRDACKWR